MIVREFAGFDGLAEEAAAAPIVTIPEIDVTPITSFYDAVDNGFDRAQQAIAAARNGYPDTAAAILNNPNDGFAFWNDQAIALLKECRDKQLFTPEEAADVFQGVLRPLGSAGAEVSRLLGEARAMAGDKFAAFLVRVWDDINRWAVEAVASSMKLWSSRWNGLVSFYGSLVRLNRQRAIRLQELKASTQRPALLESIKELEMEYRNYLSLQKMIETKILAMGITSDDLNKQVAAAGLGLQAPGMLVRVLIGIGVAASTAGKLSKTIIGVLTGLFHLITSIIGFEMAGRGGRLPSIFLPKYKAFIDEIELSIEGGRANSYAVWEAATPSDIVNKLFMDAADKNIREYRDGMTVIASVVPGDIRNQLQRWYASEEAREKAGEQAVVEAAKAGKSIEEIRAAGDRAMSIYTPPNPAAYVVGFGLAGIAVAAALWYYKKKR